MNDPSHRYFQPSNPAQISSPESIEMSPMGHVDLRILLAEQTQSLQPIGLGHVDLRISLVPPAATQTPKSNTMGDSETTNLVIAVSQPTASTQIRNGNDAVASGNINLIRVLAPWQPTPIPSQPGQHIVTPDRAGVYSVPSPQNNNFVVSEPSPASPPANPNVNVSFLPRRDVQQLPPEPLMAQPVVMPAPVPVFPMIQPMPAPQSPGPVISPSGGEIAPNADNKSTDLDCNTFCKTLRAQHLMLGAFCVLLSYSFYNSLSSVRCE